MSRADSKARTRQLLLDAARAVFAERGFNAATVEEIAERAGFTRGAFYANWPDKAEVMWELADADALVSFGELEATLDSVEMDQKMEALQSWFEGLLRPRPLQQAFNELMLQASQTPEGRRRQAQAFAKERGFLERVVGEIEMLLGVELPIPIDHFAAMGIAVGSGLAQQHLVDPDVVPSTLFGDAQAYLWFGVLAAMQSPDFSPRSGTRKSPRRGPAGTRS